MFFIYFIVFLSSGCPVSDRKPLLYLYFLPVNFQFLTPSVLGLDSGTGQTDRQTDRQTTAINSLCLHPMGTGA